MEEDVWGEGYNAGINAAWDEAKREIERLRAEFALCKADNKRLLAALENIALLDEADGHELTADDAIRAVGIATSALSKHPSEIFASRTRTK
jgi:hypothetical protein